MEGVGFGSGLFNNGCFSQGYDGGDLFFLRKQVVNLSLTFFVKRTNRMALANPWPESPIPCMEGEQHGEKQ